MGRTLLKLRRNSVIKLGKWWKLKLGERSRVVVTAVIIGILSAVAAAALHCAVHKLEKFSDYLLSGSSPWLTAAFVLLPLAGIFLSFCAQRWLGGVRYAKSLSPLILALHRRKTRIPFREVFSHLISSALSVGCGGSAGLEAPSVLTGAAIGANTSGFFSFNRRSQLLLTGCGAAAAISAIFGSPVGGVLFAVEVLLPQFSVGALIPMLISSAVAMFVSRTFFSQEAVMFSISGQWYGSRVHYYFFCALICALVGVMVIRSVYAVTSLLKRKLPGSYRRLAVGGTILCAVLMFFPLLRGQGSRAMSALVAGNLELFANPLPFLPQLPVPVMIPLMIAAAILLKAAVSALTVESGGDGGIFAPTMFIGAFTGYAFAALVNKLGVVELHTPTFIAIGMCGVFSAVLRAPLTGIFLIVEVTGSYDLLVPLMLVSSVAWAAARHFEPHSIYRKALAESGLLSEDNDRSMLQTISVRVCVNTDIPPLKPEWTTAMMRSTVENAPGTEFFPVLDDERRLIGIVKLEQLKPVLFDPISASLLVFDLMDRPKTVLSEDDDLSAAVSALERFHTNFLPVNCRNGSFMGFVTDKDIFKLYRSVVRDASSF